MQEKNELALQLLAEIEQCEDEDRYRNLRDQVYGLGHDIVELLRDELQSIHYRRRMASATNLGRLGDSAAVPQLVQLLNDPQAGVREMALFALGILGDSLAVDHILNAVNDYDSDVRYRAVVALSDLGYPQIETVLIRAMDDESYGVREQALSQLRSIGTPRAVPTVLKALLEREHDMQQMAEEALDRLIPKMTREHYKKAQEELTPRERRLILNYLEARNLQEVYGTLWQRLQLVSKATSAPRGLDKYGRLLNHEDELEYLMHAYLRDETVDLLVEHFSDEGANRSIMLVGEAGVGKTAIIQDFARKILDVDDSWNILETNTSELISGTRYLGDWETKLKEMTEAIMKQDKVVLYLTNPNDLLGAGAHSKSDENFADFFKPYLQRGQLRMIAECTEDDLKNGLSRDPGFLRLFRQVRVPEMSDEETIEVLKKRVEHLKVRDRKVTAEPSCLELVSDFSRTFYTRSSAPGRACDFLDALVDFAHRKSTFEGKDDPIVLTTDMIPASLSEVSGISLDLLDDAIPLDLEETKSWFMDRLVDQDPAIDAVVDRLSLIKAALGSPEKPLSVMFLVGPTGVGKTYFTKLVAERLFGDPKRMVRFDLSEYQGRFAVEKLIGSPHDKDREGLLTEAIRNQPFSVLLFDEFEKADPEIYNLFLQIMDEGRLTDARGKTTDFRQTLIFLTSNLGASRTSVDSIGFNEEGGVSSRIQSKLEEFFAPEFLNRLDETIIFQSLSRRAMDRLIDLELQKAVVRRGLVRRGLSVTLDADARKWLEVNGFSAKFGARELKRAIERSVLVSVSKLLVTHAAPYPNQAIQVSVTDGEITANFRAQTPKKPATPKQPKKPEL